MTEEMSTTEENPTLFQRIFSCPNTKKTYEDCCRGCDKPGLGSPSHDPYSNECGDCALVYSPCAFVCDILSCPFRMFSKQGGE